MASPSDCKRTDEQEQEQELNDRLKSLADSKKAVIVRRREVDNELWEIRREEIAIQERLQQLRELEQRKRHDDRLLAELKQMKQTVKGFKTENAKLTESLHHVTAHASDSDSKVKCLTAQLSSMKEKFAVYEISMVSIMQHITSYSETQQKEKEKLLREVASLKDKISALSQISAETQQRQLNELQPSPIHPQPHTGEEATNELIG